MVTKVIGLAAMVSASQDMQLDTTHRRVQASRHTQLSTTYTGTIEATHGISFQLENTADSSIILSGLGLNVQTSPTTMTGAGMIAGDEGPCRVKVYTRSIDGEYGLALDTSDVTCMGPEEETLISDDMFLRYYQEMNLARGLLEGEERKMQDEGHPLVIGPWSSMEVYVVVLPVEGDVSGIQPILLSSAGK
jgi:hypothetical protein